MSGTLSRISVTPTLLVLHRKIKGLKAEHPPGKTGRRVWLVENLGEGSIVRDYDKNIFLPGTDTTFSHPRPQQDILFLKPNISLQHPAVIGKHKPAHAHHLCVLNSQPYVAGICLHFEGLREIWWGQDRRTLESSLQILKGSLAFKSPPPR